jgi:hypothetical protein
MRFMSEREAQFVAAQVGVDHHLAQLLERGFGFQPSSRWALAGSPISSSTSAGR